MARKLTQYVIGRNSDRTFFAGVGKFVKEPELAFAQNWEESNRTLAGWRNGFVGYTIIPLKAALESRL